MLFFVSRYGMFFARGGVRRMRPLAALHFSLRSLLSLNNLEMSRPPADTFGRLCGEKRTCVMAYFDLDANPSTNSIFEKTQDALTESCVKQFCYYLKMVVRILRQQFRELVTSNLFSEMYRTYDSSTSH